VTRRGLGSLLCVGLPLIAASLSDPSPAAVFVTQTTGTLIVDWTIQGRADLADCRLANAEAVQIHVVGSNGADAGTYEQSCAAFETSIVLEPGTYSATALLVDVARVPRSTTVTIIPFSLFGNDVIRTPIDFPATSFF